LIFVFGQNAAGVSAVTESEDGSSDARVTTNYRKINGILDRLTKLCVQDTGSGRKPRQQEQRLLRNMGAHSAILELLQIPYDKVMLHIL
jgi:inositol 1,4,5-triphosphate receptor type 1